MEKSERYSWEGQEQGFLAFYRSCGSGLAAKGASLATASALGRDRGSVDGLDDPVEAVLAGDAPVLGRCCFELRLYLRRR